MTTQIEKTGATAPPYAHPLRLFEGAGIELEYMIVDRETLDVKPIADELLKAVAGAYAADAEPDGPDGVIGWSNELALHVIEFKTARPVESLDDLPPRFQDHVRRADELLEPMGARLLPTGMHPWMDPHAEMRLWPHEASPIYEAFDRVFSCKGHGWANLQSAHINLPFADDEEFGRLHAAIRLVLPLLPALAASSPIMDGAWSPITDHRLDVYRKNAKRVPSVAGLLIPEPVYTRDEYEREILGRIYDDMAPLDPEGILRHEWVNARGAIARFQRGSIEIRLLDVQECPLADMAIAALVIETVRAHVEERWLSYEQQREFSARYLTNILSDTIRYAERTRISDTAFLRAFGVDRSMTWSSDVWKSVRAELMPEHPVFGAPLTTILEKGTLASRINSRTRRFPTREQLREIYTQLAECLLDGRLLDG